MNKVPIVYFERFVGLEHDNENKKIFVHYEMLSYEDLKKDDFLEDLKNGEIHCVVVDEFDCVVTSRADVRFK